MQHPRLTRAYVTSLRHVDPGPASSVPLAQRAGHGTERASPMPDKRKARRRGTGHPSPRCFRSSCSHATIARFLGHLLGTRTEHTPVKCT